MSIEDVVILIMFIGMLAALALRYDESKRLKDRIRELEKLNE